MQMVSDRTKKIIITLAYVSALLLIAAVGYANEGGEAAHHADDLEDEPDHNEQHDGVKHDPDDGCERLRDRDQRKQLLNRPEQESGDQ